MNPMQAKKFLFVNRCSAVLFVAFLVSERKITFRLHIFVAASSRVTHSIFAVRVIVM